MAEVTLEELRASGGKPARAMISEAKRGKKWKQDPSYAKCHNDVKTGADLVAGVTAMAQGCAGPLKMHQIGQTTQDTFKNLDKAHPIPLHAWEGALVKEMTNG